MITIALLSPRKGRRWTIELAARERRPPVQPTARLPVTIERVADDAAQLDRAVLPEVAVGGVVRARRQSPPVQAVPHLAGDDREAPAIGRGDHGHPGRGEHPSQLLGAAPVVGQVLDGVVADEGIERVAPEREVLHVPDDPDQCHPVGCRRRPGQTHRAEADVEPDERPARCGQTDRRGRIGPASGVEYPARRGRNGGDHDRGRLRPRQDGDVALAAVRLLEVTPQQPVRPLDLVRVGGDEGAAHVLGMAGEGIERFRLCHPPMMAPRSRPLRFRQKPLVQTFRCRVASDRIRLRATRTV